MVRKGMESQVSCVQLTVCECAFHYVYCSVDTWQLHTKVSGGSVCQVCVCCKHVVRVLCCSIHSYCVCVVFSVYTVSAAMFVYWCV